MTPRRVFHERGDTILVVDSGGLVGSSLIADLLSRRQSVRALVPDAGRSPVLPSVDVVQGDPGDASALMHTLEGVDRLFLGGDPSPDSVRGNRIAIQLAREAGVRLVVRRSMLGAVSSSPATVLKQHGLCDLALESSGVPYVILRANLPLQTVVRRTIPSIDAAGRFRVNAGGARISMVDERDVAAAAAVVLTEPGHEGRRYDLTGPEALTFAEIARRLARAIGWPTTYLDTPDDAIHALLLDEGMDAWLAEATIGLFADYRRSGPFGYAAAVTESVERLTRASPRTLDGLIAEWLPPPSPPAA